jgi:hypothetical protein
MILNLFLSLSLSLSISYYHIAHSRLSVCIYNDDKMKVLYFIVLEQILIINKRKENIYTCIVRRKKARKFTICSVLTHFNL